MDDLLSDFIAETQEGLEALSSVVVTWESEPNDRERLDAVFRFFHTVKGSCGFLHLPRFERLSHAAEDVLSHIREGEAKATPRTISAVLAVMDRIGELCSATHLGEALPQENDGLLIEALLHCQDEAAVDDQDGHASLIETEQKGKDPNRPRTIRLPLSLIDQLMNGVSDMVLVRNEMSRKLRERDADPELETVFERLSICIADMRDSISKTRMQRVERLFMAVPRLVRDLSRELGKQIELHLEGGEVEMDREMVELVLDPLTHIVRNSIDHGIETPTERRAAGKTPTGRLSLAARQSGSQIVIEIVDDGRGINVEAIARKALIAGLTTPQDIVKLSEQEMLELIFAPGFSTADKVTSVSGRGVGMDVVRANIERLGGVITLTNRPGQGLTTSLRVPLTLSIIPGLILTAGCQQFAIPRSSVIEILHDNNAMVELSHLGGADFATIRGTRYAMVELESVIGLPRQEMPGPRTLLLVRSASGAPYALNVASVENHEELVIRPAAPIVMASGVYAGMTLPDNGQPLLLLDAGGIAQSQGIVCDPVAPATAIESEIEAQVARYPALQFIELDGSERLIRLSLVERVDDIKLDRFGTAGNHHHARIDGRLLPCFRAPSLDAAAAAEPHFDYVTCLRLRDGQKELLYPIRSIVDIHDIAEELDLVCVYDHIAGLALVDGRQIEVIDAFALFAALGDAPAGDLPHNRQCLIDNPDDSWNREILAPLLRQAGYEVLLDQALVTDHSRVVMICTQSAADTAPAAESVSAPMPLVRLRPTSEPDGPEDNSIYRYDREGLMRALAKANRAHPESRERMSA